MSLGKRLLAALQFEWQAMRPGLQPAREERASRCVKISLPKITFRRARIALSFFERGARAM